MASLHINAPPGTPLVSPSRVNVTPYPNRYPTAATPYALDGQGAAAVGYTYTPKTVGSGPMSTATPKTGYAPGTPLPAGVAVVVPASSVPHRVEKHPERQRKMGAEVTNNFKKPQQIFASAVSLAEYKAEMRPDKTLVLGFLAGAYIALAGCICLTFGGGVPTIKHDDPGLAKFLFAALFPFGIILVVIAGAELVTSNLAIMPAAVLARRVSVRGMCRNWFFAYLGNFLGSLFVAAALVYASGIVDAAPWHDFTTALVEKKVFGATWGQQVLKGIGCNWLVCLGFWTALAAEDVIGKIWALWFPIAAFVIIGFEHSVMNMFLIPAGMMLGANVSVGDFLGRNLIPVTIGNIFGGLLVAVPYWYVYWLPTHQTHPFGQTKAFAAMKKCCRCKRSKNQKAAKSLVDTSVSNAVAAAAADIELGAKPLDTHNTDAVGDASSSNNFEIDNDAADDGTDTPKPVDDRPTVVALPATTTRPDGSDLTITDQQRNSQAASPPRATGQAAIPPAALNRLKQQFH